MKEISINKRIEQIKPSLHGAGYIFDSLSPLPKGKNYYFHLIDTVYCRAAKRPIFIYVNSAQHSLKRIALLGTRHFCLDTIGETKPILR